jgi:hypothetical protein
VSKPFTDYRQQIGALAPQAMTNLVAIMNNQNAPAMTSLRAAKLILDLACGRPVAERVTCEAERPQDP